LDQPGIDFPSRNNSEAEESSFMQLMLLAAKMFGADPEYAKIELTKVYNFALKLVNVSRV